MPNAARAPKIIEMPLKRSGDSHESFVPASIPNESPAAIAARKLEALAHFHLALEEYEEALDAFRRLLKLIPTVGSAPGQSLSKYRPSQPVFDRFAGSAVSQIEVETKCERFGFG